MQSSAADDSVNLSMRSELVRLTVRMGSNKGGMGTQLFLDLQQSFVEKRRNISAKPKKAVKSKGDPKRRESTDLRDAKS
jgi:hypothetical protein